MQEVVTFGEILNMRLEKFVFESKKNMGKIVYALVHEIFELRKELEEIRLSGIFRDSEPELYQINQLFSRSVSVLQNSSGQLKI